MIMVNTYKYISAESIFAQVKEEFKSYFNTGIVDDLLFPKYAHYVLTQFNKTYLRKREIPLQLQDGWAQLPDDLESVKEVYICRTTGYHIPLPGAQFYFKDCRVDYKYRHRCDECANSTNSCTSCDRCINKDYNVLHMITGAAYLSYSVSGELLPDSFTRSRRCSNDCNVSSSIERGFYSISEDGCRIMTHFDSGVLHVVYYSNSIEDTDSVDGYQIMIPDRKNFLDYLIKYLKYKVMEVLFNSTTDETFNQVAQKYQLYKREMEEAYGDALIESKSQSLAQKAHTIMRTRNRFNRYKLR